MEIRGFRAMRPRWENAERVTCLPYDVMTDEEARAIAAGGGEEQFVRVVRPEVMFPRGVDEHSDAVYQAGRDALEGLLRSGAWVEESERSLWVYALRMGEREQVGVYGCVGVEAYDSGLIVRHEKTRIDKEEDRTRHLVVQQAHAEPVMLTYADDGGIDVEVRRAMEASPDVEVNGPGDVVHRLWRVSDVAGMERAFGAVERMYVADGHHRCAAASRASREHGAYGWFPAVMFPMGQMKIWPYHRALVGVGGDVVGRLAGVVALEAGRPEPRGAGWVSVYDGAWWEFALPETRGGAVSDTLDVARLSEFVLGPVYGVEDLRTDRRIRFVGGIRGAGELERMVNAGEADVAFSMCATSMESFRAVSDAGELMPPKSTWFEPKLLSGLLIQRFGGL